MAPTAGTGAGARQQQRHRHLQPQDDGGSLVRLRAIVDHLASARCDSKKSTGSAQTTHFKLLKPTIRWDGWGYADTRLFLNESGQIEITGERYGEVFESKHDRVLPHLRPWAERVIGLDVTHKSLPTNRSLNAIQVDQSHLVGATKQALENFLKDMQTKDIQATRAIEECIHRSHGQTCEDIYRIRHNSTARRVVDAVVFPKRHEQVEQIVQEAVRHKVGLVPYGGGTNVTNALECPTQQKCAIVCIDLREMQQILYVDKENMTIIAEAGITGYELHQKLQLKQLTLGHEPDSWEFSTLGGWIATRASGMKKNVYGNIEDMVLDITMVTPTGTLRKNCALPRVSMGPDMNHVAMGSEGILGVVTQVTLRVRPFPSVQRYDSLLFPTFVHGVMALKDIVQAKCVPASLRLLDNVQFQLGQGLKPASSSKFAGSALDFAKKFYITKVKGFDVYSMCAATILMEGTQEEVDRQHDAIKKIAARHFGVVTGIENGLRGYLLTYLIAYLRDFAMDYYFVSESFETCVPWSNIQQLCTDLKLRICQAAHDAEEPPSVAPLVCCRVTQLYETGVAVYVYYGINYFGVKDPLKLMKTIEKAAVETILLNKGSLSHHHGVGKHRKPWLAQAISLPAMAAIKGIKQALDPQNTFVSGNLIGAPAND